MQKMCKFECVHTSLYSISKKRIGVFDCLIDGCCCWTNIYIQFYYFWNFFFQISLTLILVFFCLWYFLSYFEQASALINELLEQFGNDKLPDDVTDECRGLLADREILINSCATSHDTHLSKLLTVEEGLRNRYVFHSSSIMY